MAKLEFGKNSPDTPVNELNVNMSNALVRAAHGLTLAEKRVVSVCIAKTDSVRQNKEGYRFKLTADEFAETFDVDTNTAYEQMVFAGDNLMKRIAKKIEKGKSGNIVEHKWNWMSAVIYHHGEGWIELEFSHYMTPHLTLLRQQFTSYKLKQASDLRSIYSWRLFELLMQFKTTGVLHIDIGEFCHAMEAPESAVKDFAQLRKRIIEPAVAELKAKNGMDIEWAAKRQGGRKINALEFVFLKQPRPAPPATDSIPAKKARKPGGRTIYGVTIADIEKLALAGESYETAAARIANNRKLGLSG
ncbi:MAG: replication initiation protein [Candidatus Thermoplasmatota archaeon]|nr:replication initiation protein [Candidatus Thermoplasmatota archaeon]